HFQPIPRDELDCIERIVNEQICRNTPVQTEIRATAEAVASGAMALFGEKYGDRVRVVTVPGFSVELCGGTHVTATGDIRAFVRVSDGGVAAGVRRIEALTGSGAVESIQHQRGTLASITSALHAGEAQALDAIERLQGENKRLARELSQMRTRVALGGGADTTGGGRDDAEIAGGELPGRRRR